jgi:hypothetical protein
LEQRARPALSPALLEAQERLALLRQERRRERVARGLPVFTGEDGRISLPLSQTASSAQTELQTLPPHLGWESEPLSRALRRALTRHASISETASPTKAPADDRPGTMVFHSAPIKEGVLPLGGEMKLYPDVALAMLREEQSACGRVWLLLHHLDQQRCGWLPLAAARRHLSGSGSPWRLCSWRQLRNLWRQGEGVFWQRDQARIWLRGTARVAAALGVARLAQRPVRLPVATLLQGVGTFRAHLYASFHSTRSHGCRQSNPLKPIARATLQAISHVGPRTQRAYEERARVRRQANFALATALRQEDGEERAWQHGRALFSFNDQKGKQGRPGAVYLAWQLPNHYTGPHAPSSRGRQKRINQRLADLFMQGMTGNGKKEDENGPTRRQRFYGTGMMAAKAYSRTPEADLYWLNERHANGRCTLWYLLPGQPNSRARSNGLT